jgi:hypothetical protein
MDLSVDAFSNNVDLSLPYKLQFENKSTKEVFTEVSLLNTSSIPFFSRKVTSFDLINCIEAALSWTLSKILIALSAIPQWRKP